MTREPMLSVKEFAAFIGVHPRTIYRRIWAHRQPGVHRFGRDIRIDRAEALRSSSASSASSVVSCIARPALGGLYTRV
jgi:excisionase family DNA binding protein